MLTMLWEDAHDAHNALRRCTRCSQCSEKMHTMLTMLWEDAHDAHNALRRCILYKAHYALRRCIQCSQCSEKMHILLTMLQEYSYNAFWRCILCSQCSEKMHTMLTAYLKGAWMLLAGRANSLSLRNAFGACFRMHLMFLCPLIQCFIAELWLWHRVHYIDISWLDWVFKSSTCDVMYHRQRRHLYYGGQI
jgi:hypothetical protein